MFRLKLFGGAALEGAQGEASIASRRRSLAFLALLAGAGDRGLSRDKLAAFLWAESDSDRSRHALAQTLYAIRRELSAELVQTAGNDLKLHSDLIAVDLWDFERAISRGDLEAATAAYGGPFLDGFYISDALEFERWVESERARLAHAFKQALYALEKRAAQANDWRGASEWLRRAVTADPLDSPLALRYMRALAAAGDRAAAIRHGRVHETLIREELKLTAGPELRAYMQQLREELRLGTSGSVAPAVDAPLIEVKPRANDAPRRSSPNRLLAPSPPPSVAVGSHVAPAEVEPAAPAPATAAARWRAPLVLKVSAAVLAVVLPLSLGSRLVGRAHATNTPVVAVGSIRELGGADTTGIVRALAEMLATNISRVPDLHVISNTRIYEIVGRTSAVADESARLATAAERAGATEIIQGVLSRRGNEGMRLDIQRIDLGTGRVQGAYSVEGRDLFALVDSATAKLAADLRLPRSDLRVADVTTTSLVAQRFYDEGLRAYYQVGDPRSALRLFQLALQEDSNFAMASYYAAHAAISIGDGAQLTEGRHALRTSKRASDRERLLINAELRDLFSDPSGRMYAESLVAKYPNEPTSHLIIGNVYIHDGDFLAAVPHLRRAIEIDSFNIDRQRAVCRACEGYGLMTLAYMHADSMAMAERTARELVARAPQLPGALMGLANVMEQMNRPDEALHYWGRMAEVQGTGITSGTRARIWIRAGQFSEADALLSSEASDANSPVSSRNDALWFGLISKRYQGQMTASRRIIDEMFKLAPGDYTASQGLGQLMFETGHYAESAKLFASLARIPNYPEMPWRTARDVSWNLAHVTTSVAAMGDTVRLKRLADSLERIGTQSSYGRDGRLHHYARGFLARARGDEAGAAEEFRRAIYSPSMGFTRANFELGRSLLALHRPAEAVPVLRAALQGSLEASNFYLTHTELHELLGRAYEASGQRDSARVHYEWVSRAWEHADEPFRTRGANARQRAVMLRAANEDRARVATLRRAKT